VRSKVVVSYSGLFLFLVSGFFLNQIKAQCNLSSFPSVEHNCAQNLSYISFTISGTTPGPYQFTVSSPGGVNNGTTATNTGTAPYYGVFIYNVFIMAANGCTAMNSTQVTPSFTTQLIAGSITATNVSCFGAANGTAFVTPPLSFNPGPISYSWTPGGFTTQAVTTLSAGIVYSVLTQNTNSCAVTNTVLLSQPSEINTVLSNTFVTCFGGTLLASPTSTGGLAPYTYSLNGIPSGTSIVLSAGVYSLQTRDNQACIKTNTIQILQSPQVGISFTAASPSCPGKSDGSLNAFITNAPAPVVYSWQPQNSSSSGLNNIPAGNYTVTVTDASACITSSVTTVLPASSITASATTQPENCSAADGAYTLNISGGTNPYTYTTFPGGSTSTITGNLSSGTYTTYITDFKQCLDTLVFVLGNLSTVSLNIVSTTSVNCYNGCTGAVALNAVNGTAPYTYSASGLPTTTNNILQGMCPGFYFIKVTDANLCPATITLQLNNPPQLSYSVTQPPTICIGKSSTLTAQAQGGTGSYAYVWNPGNLSGQQVQVAPNISTIYSLNVYDVNSCTGPAYQVTVFVNAPLTISVNPNTSGICPGTTAQITPTVTGGDGLYSYLWLPGNTTGSSLYIENISTPSYTFVVNDNCGSPTAVKVIDLEVYEVIPPTYTTSSSAGCAPFCPTFINTSANSIKASWNYGDDANEQIGDTTVNCYAAPGKYNVLLTVLDQHSCSATAWFNNAVEAYPQPKVDFITEPKKITRSAANNVLLIDASNDAEFYNWFVDGLAVGNTKEVSVNFPDTLCYAVKLVAQSSKNCVDSTTKQICVYEDFNFYMPNVFTPNNDGLNDVLKPQGTGWSSKDYTFNVYNQWGGLEFSTNDIYSGWDANWRINPSNAKLPKADKEDAYLWTVEIVDRIGEKHQLNGSVIILR
jgi:gliding motility-associated-like protein